MFDDFLDGSQVATKEILRFEALWLKHFKDTRGDVLKAGPHVRN